MLTVDKLSVSVSPKKLIIKDITFEAKNGEIVGILGPSGVGKTTLFRAISGLVAPRSGLISLDGNNLVKIPVSYRPISYLQQSFPLYKNLTVLQNVLVAFNSLNKDEYYSSRNRAEHILLNLGISEDLLNRMPQSLSGGEAQRVALGKSLLKPCRILLLDEPFSNIDKNTKRNLMHIIHVMAKSNNKMILYVSHDENDLLLISDKLIVMHDGKIIQVGSPKDLVTSPLTGKVASIGSPVGLQVLEINELIALNVLDDLSNLRPPQASKIGWHPYESKITIKGSSEIKRKGQFCVICGQIEKIIEIGNQMYYGIRVDSLSHQGYIWHIESIRDSNVPSIMLGEACEVSINTGNVFFLDNNDNIIHKDSYYELL